MLVPPEDLAWMDAVRLDAVRLDPARLDPARCYQTCLPRTEHHEALV
jgi:hypothetical protein